MKYKFLSFLLLMLWSVGAVAQRNCGQAIILDQLEQSNPGAKALFKELQKEAIVLGSKYRTTEANWRTTSSILIPVVFHIVVDSNQFNQMGGTAGIEERMFTQIQVINEDFNGANTDQSKVPSVWKPLFANVGIDFELAHVSPSGSYSPGYEIKIVPVGTSYEADNAAKAAKFSASGGLDGWDYSRYLNVWVCNLTNFGSTVLGLTVPPGLPGYTLPERGVVLHHFAFGMRTSWKQNFIANIDLGRTLTHELGHYFLLFHTWGDDGGLCAGSGGDDDGITDTPPQADASYGAPSFPQVDACSPASPGIMFMNYMDYSNDASMYMFTKEQAGVMKAQVASGGSSYSLTQHPELNIETVSSAQSRIYPNPTKGYVFLDYDAARYLDKVEVVNMLGQICIIKTEQNIKTIDMSHLHKGLYFVRCYFGDETLIKKIILE